MKYSNIVRLMILTALLATGLSGALTAQDDLYYDPERDVQVRTYSDNDESYITKRYSGDEYDDDYYDYEDDYAYEYSSRIRRFHRPVSVIDYYDPFFVDLYYYDPFFLPGASIYTYGFNDYYTWRRWNRWNRFNNWGWGNPYVGFGYSPWGGGWGAGFGGGWGWNSWNAWNNTYVFNNYYYDPYWTWNGCNPYYGNNWNTNNYYYNNQGYNNGYVPQTYTGIRRHGTSVQTGYTRISGNGRITAEGNGPMIEKTNRTNGRVVEVDREPVRVEERSGATQPVTREGRTPSSNNPAEVAREGRSTRPENEVIRDTRDTRATREAPSTRPERAPEVRPNTRTEQPSRPQQPSRQQQTRPSRPSGDSGYQPRSESRPDTRSEQQPATRPSRPSYDRSSERPSRPSYERPSTPSRSYDTPSRSYDRPSSSPSRSNSGGGYSPSSSGRSSSGSSGSSGRSSSGSSGSRRGGR